MSTERLLVAVEEGIRENAMLDEEYRHSLLENPRAKYEEEIELRTGTRVRVTQEIRILADGEAPAPTPGVRWLRIPRPMPGSGSDATVALSDLEGVNPFFTVLSPTNACTAQSGCGSCVTCSIGCK